MSLNLRPAELAGTWYPASDDACRGKMQAWGASLPSDEAVGAMGALAPHGGWDGAGGVAFRPLRALAQARPAADLVILLGGHLDPSDPPRVFLEGGFATPRGPVPVAETLAKEAALAWDAEPESPDDYYDDNAIEVLMPMVAHLWPGVPAFVGGFPPNDDASRAGAELADLVAPRAERPVLVASVDFTHYGADYGFRPAGPIPAARDWVLDQNDPPILDAVRRVDGARVVWTARQHRSTCSAGSLAAALTCARRLGARSGRVLEHTTTWDLKGRPRNAKSFVSYASAVFTR